MSTDQYCVQDASCHDAPEWRRAPGLAPEDHVAQPGRVTQQRAECLAGYLCFSLSALTGSQVAIGRLPFCALRNSSEVYLKAAAERKVRVF